MKIDTGNARKGADMSICSILTRESAKGKTAAEENKKVSIDFSAAKYTVGRRRKTVSVELIPDHTDFLSEVAAIYPPSEYDIRIVQDITQARTGKAKLSVALFVEVSDRNTGEPVADSMAKLSDRDYAYIRDILAAGVPEYEWQTADECLCDDIKDQLLIGEHDNAFFMRLTDEAWGYLNAMVLARRNEIKDDGFVDFNYKCLEDMANRVMTDALRTACERLCPGGAADSAVK